MKTQHRQYTARRVMNKWAVCAATMTLFVVFLHEMQWKAPHQDHHNSSSFNRSRFRFVEYRHLEVATDFECQWTSITSIHDQRAKKLIGTSGGNADEVQIRTLNDGLCYPSSSFSLSNTLPHIFSKRQALACTARQTIYFTGDSYAQNLFIGLAELLHPELIHEYEFFNGTQRYDATVEANDTLRRHTDSDNGMQRTFLPRIQFICRQECRGSESDFVTACPQCLRQESEKDALLIFGSAIHLFLQSNHSAKFTLDSLETVIFKIMASSSNNKMLYSFPQEIPHMELVPIHRQPLMKDFLLFHDDLRRFLVSKFPTIPILDWKHLTATCDMANCSVDGHHKTRHVNRWKAQLLLNTLCVVA